ncbi:hypothetical protein EDB84DRAFT_1677241 [Lactarius hengduanensis]|nr:hypothetical protein EDB84DRAFT_1677241 [Lactarius hengduanensis]
MQRASPTADNDYSIDDKDDNSKDQDINTDNTSTNDTDVTDNDSRGARSTVAAVTWRRREQWRWQGIPIATSRYATREICYVQAGAWATGSGFSKRQAGPKASSGPHFGLAWPGFSWPGLAWLLASGPSQQITTSMNNPLAYSRGLDSDGVAAVARRSLLIVLTREFNLYPSHMSQRILLTLGRTFIHHYQWGVLVQHLARLSPHATMDKGINGCHHWLGGCHAWKERCGQSSPPEGGEIPSPVQGPIRSEPDLDFSHDCHGQECYLYGPTVPTTSSQAYNGYYPHPCSSESQDITPSPAELQPEIPIFPITMMGFSPAGYPDDPVTPHYPAIAFETILAPWNTHCTGGSSKDHLSRGGYLILIAQMLSLMTPLPIQSLTQAKTGTRQSGTSGYHLPTSHPPPEKHCDLLTMASSHQAKEAPPTELSPAIRVLFKAPPVLPPVLSQSESVIAAVAEKQHHCLLCGISFTQSQISMKTRNLVPIAQPSSGLEGVLTCTEGISEQKHSELTFSGEPPWSTRKAHVLRARQYKFPNNRSQVVSREPPIPHAGDLREDLRAHK